MAVRLDGPCAMQASQRPGASGRRRRLWLTSSGHQDNITQVTRTQVYLTPKQHRALKREASRQRVSMTEILRRILDMHLLGLGSGGRPAKELVLSFVALGESGRKDVSASHDRALDEALRAGSPR